MTETTATETAAPTALEAVANRPLLVDETPVDDGCNTVELWVREGDELATMRVTEVTADDEDNEITAEIDTYLRTDELFEIAGACGAALAALGDRANLAALIGLFAEQLARMKN